MASAFALVAATGAQASPQYQYNAANQLAKVTLDDGTIIENFYDGLGNLVRQAVDGDSRDIILNELAAYPTVIGVVPTSGDTERVAYGPDGAVAERSGSDSTRYLVKDQLGTIKGNADNSGDLLGRQALSAYGVPRGDDGEGSVLGYTGEYVDESGLVYLRARHYNPALARFVQKDSYEGHASDPASMNNYSYVHNNPLSLTDPSGHCPSCIVVAHKAGVLAIKAKEAILPIVAAGGAMVANSPPGRFVRNQTNNLLTGLGLKSPPLVAVPVGPLLNLPPLASGAGPLMSTSGSSSSSGTSAGIKPVSPKHCLPSSRFTPDAEAYARKHGDANDIPLDDLAKNRKDWVPKHPAIHRKGKITRQGREIAKLTNTPYRTRGGVTEIYVPADQEVIKGKLEVKREGWYRIDAFDAGHKHAAADIAQDYAQGGPKNPDIRQANKDPANFIFEHSRFNQVRGAKRIGQGKGYPVYSPHHVPIHKKP